VDNPEVKALYREAMAGLIRACPEIEIFRFLSNDSGAIRVTIARWYTPNDRQIAEIGLTPDVEVELTEEDIEAGLDPQLDKAIEILMD